MAIKINKNIQISDSTTSLEQLAKITNIDQQLQDTNGHRVNGFNGRLTSLNFSKTANEYATTREDLLTGSVTDMSDKPGDGFVKTFYWDNSGTYDTQIYIPNNSTSTIRMRNKDGGSSWGSWNMIGANNIAYKKQLNLERYIQNRKPHQAYTSSGAASWYKLIHLPSTGGWSSYEVVFLITSSNGSVKAIADIGYYNNSTIRADIHSGNIPANNLGYVKNSDNSLDVCLYVGSAYVPIFVSALSVADYRAEAIDEIDIWNGGAVPTAIGTPSLTGRFSYMTH